MATRDVKWRKQSEGETYAENTNFLELATLVLKEREKWANQLQAVR